MKLFHALVKRMQLSVNQAISLEKCNSIIPLFFLTAKDMCSAEINPQIIFKYIYAKKIYAMFY